MLGVRFYTTHEPSPLWKRIQMMFENIATSLQAQYTDGHKTTRMLYALF